VIRWNGPKGLFASCCVLAANLFVPASDASTDFKVSRTTPVGGEGSWDYATFDSVHHRLYVARVGGVLVLDTETMKPIGTIPAFAGTRVHGIALAPDLSFGVTGDGEDQVATVFDLNTLAVKRRVALGIAPDSVIYDPASKRAIAFDGDNNVAVAFDPNTGNIDARIKLPGSPEAPAVDGRGKLFINLSDISEVATIDTRSWLVAGHEPIGGGCQDPTPLSIDQEHGRLFIGCRSGVLVVLDAATHAIVASLPIGKGADGVGYDSHSGLVFVSCFDGTMTIISSSEATGYAVVQTVATAPGARTMALDTNGPRAFLPVADLGPALPKTAGAPSRSAIVPSTFRILSVSR
jgi:DNA-binding beta-propeller fold protein YncE